MIKRAPLKKDPKGSCSRWHVVVYNKETKKRDWHTVRGTKDDAKAFKRKFESAKRDGDYTGPLERKSFEEVANLFMPRAASASACPLPAGSLNCTVAASLRIARVLATAPSSSFDSRASRESWRWPRPQPITLRQSPRFDAGFWLSTINATMRTRVPCTYRCPGTR